MCSVSSAQFGVRLGYNLNTASAWDDFFSTQENRAQNVFSTSYGIEVDYWTRLKNQRVEFYPYISYYQANTTLSSSLTSLSLRQIGAGLKSHIYFLDFHGDCDCPTFSKQGGLFQKGFFLLAGVGTDFAQKAIGAEAHRDGNIDVRASLGLGLDIGISDLLTITPFVAYQRFFDVSWHEVGSTFGQEQVNVSSTINQLQVGVRIGLRGDYESPRF